MSYTLLPYLVDLDALRGALGSRDEALFAAIVGGDPDEFADDGEDGELSLARALRHLIQGKPLLATAAYQYGYALEHLCRYYGEMLPSDCWESIRWQVLEQTGFAEVLDRTGPPVPLPPSTDFPRIAHLTPEAAAGILAKAGDQPLRSATGSRRRRRRRSLGTMLLQFILPPAFSRPPMSDDDLRETLDEYAGWLRTAVERNLGLVFFYY